MSKTPTIALVTGTGGPAFVDDVDRPLIAALEQRGARVQRPVWHDHDVRWDAFDLALVRTTWDYTSRRDEFVAWATRAGEATRLWNPPEVIRWNTHKSYLLELEDRGAPVVPTAWLAQGDRVDLDVLLTRRGWARAVVKPAVGASSEGLLLVAAGEARERGEDADVVAGQAHLDGLLARGDVMVQPFLDGVAVSGELSVVVIDGDVSHAVRKVPVGGEFRVQEEFGGRNQAVSVDPEVAALARWTVESTGVELLVARVDLLEDAAGTLQLAELEATEPDLYLDVAPQAAGRLADAILRRSRR